MSALKLTFPCLCVFKHELLDKLDQICLFLALNNCHLLLLLFWRTGWQRCFNSFIPQKRSTYSQNCIPDVTIDQLHHWPCTVCLLLPVFTAGKIPTVWASQITPINLLYSPFIFLSSESGNFVLDSYVMLNICMGWGFYITFVKICNGFGVEWIGYIGMFSSSSISHHHSTG